MIEPKWQRIGTAADFAPGPWGNRARRTCFRPTPPKYASRTTAEGYTSDMSPTLRLWPPVGIPRATPPPTSSTANRRALVYNVLHPNGLDAFGLPAEAITPSTPAAPAQNDRGKHRQLQKRQINSLGFSYVGPARWDTTDRNTQMDPIGFSQTRKLLVQPPNRSRRNR